MAFTTDDIYRLGGSQRAKLQYHILAQQFPLVHVAAEDKEDLERFAAQSETEAAQLWLARMRWPQGHEKMVSFGQALSVEDKASVQFGFVAPKALDVSRHTDVLSERYHFFVALGPAHTGKP